MTRVTVLVSPGASRTELVGRHGDAWRVRVAAPAEKGRANEALCAWLAHILDVSRSQISVVAGGTSRRKMVEVTGATADVVDRALDRLGGG